MSETATDYVDNLSYTVDRILGELEQSLARLRESVKRLEVMAAELGYVEEGPCS